MFTENQVQGSINTVDRQLLFDIRTLLKRQNELLERLVGNENIQGGINPLVDHKNASTDELDGLKRPELMKRVSQLTQKPEGWNRLDNKELVKLLKGA